MNVMPIDTADQEEVIDILTEAFRDDPVMNWISRRPGSIRTIFSMTVPLYICKGVSFKVAGGGATAVWLGPGDQVDWPRSLSSLLAFSRALGLGGMIRTLKSGAQTEKAHPSAPHYYLLAIGTLAESRGKGEGSALLRHVLRRCDEKGTPAYLENSNPANTAFYQGHGFEITQEIRFGRDAPPVWSMWRDPQAS